MSFLDDDSCNDMMVKAGDCLGRALKLTGTVDDDTIERITRPYKNMPPTVNSVLLVCEKISDTMKVRSVIQ